MSRPRFRTTCTGSARAVIRVVAVFAALTVVSGLLLAGAAEAATLAAPRDLQTVISNIVRWLVGLLVSLATLFLTIGGIRYLLAGGDPGEVAKAKDTLKYAALGYGVAVLAPVLAGVLKGLVSG